MMWSAFAVLLFGLMNSCRAQEQTSVKETTILFEWNGIRHRESRRVEDNLVTLTDAVDGFLVVLDYEREIIMLKNTTTQTCYLSSLKNVPIKKDEEIPIFVQQATEDSKLETEGQNEYVLLLTPTGKIPSTYLRLTNNVKVAGRCFSQPSYWSEIKSISRRRRSADCNWDCVGNVAVGVLIGLAFFG